MLLERFPPKNDVETAAAMRSMSASSATVKSRTQSNHSRSCAGRSAGHSQAAHHSFMHWPGLEAVAHRYAARVVR